MYSLIFYLPCLLLVLILFLSRLLGIFYISLFIIFITLCLISLALFALFEICFCGFNTNLILFHWLNCEYLYINFEFYFDSLSIVMYLMIILISFLVYLYSIEYMYNDPYYIRFMFYLVLFTFFMTILIFSSNFLQFFLGWEGVGVVSYLLINFWYTRIEANRSAIKAILLNKIGDIGLYFSMVLIYYFFKSLDFSIIFLLAPDIYNLNNYFFLTKVISFYTLDIICFFLFIAVIGKSAQLGLHMWLADAMEGPTPVSALIHAATMVTAGVFLLIRMSFLFEFSKNILILVIILGSLTAIFSSLIGLVQFDLKKVIAYSTCSQLGYMVSVCGVSGYNYALFHMFNHAFFKALLFLFAGCIIIMFNGEQDIRKMFLGVTLYPLLNIILLIASFSLIGIPFFSSFYSKEVILENIYFSFTISSLFSYWLGSLTILCTVLYSLKIFFFIFWNNYYKKKFFYISNINLKFILKSKILIKSVLIILLFFSILSSFFFQDILIGPGTDIIFSSVFISPQNNISNFFEFLPFLVKVTPFLFTLMGYFFSFFIYNYIWKIFLFLNFYYVIDIFKKKIYFDLLVFYLSELYFFFIYDILFKLLDKNLFEKFGPRGLVFFLYLIWNKINKNYKGYIFDNLDNIFFYLINYFLLIFIFSLSYENLIILLSVYLFLFLFDFLNFKKIIKNVQN